ncbi:hypothetical protein FRB93_012094 [Tulasnella sp. JGI-2019a]|nr:hypothetical protein FRB93_012094 [Tulasnella sp. JGI-2019a]
MDSDEIDINAIPENPGDVPECRICGGVAEESAPLFYPCKCSGTIRYIHQECLTTWLKHSKKRSCDVCKYPYSFTKVYKEDMPDTIPVHIVIKRIFKQLFSTMNVGFRAWLVVMIWLTIVPYLTVWAWRCYFWLGDQIAWNVYGPPSPDEIAPGRPNRTDTVGVVFSMYKSSMNVWLFPNVTRIDEIITTMEMNPGAFNKIAEKFLDRLAADVVNGQLVTAGIVFAFLATFLMREWVAQNAMPGVFAEDGVDDQVNVAMEVIEEEVVGEQPLVVVDAERGADHEEEAMVQLPIEQVDPNPGGAASGAPTAVEPTAPDEEQSLPIILRIPERRSRDFIKGFHEEIVPGEEEPGRREMRQELAETKGLEGRLGVVSPDDASAKGAVRQPGDAGWGPMGWTPVAQVDATRKPPESVAMPHNVNRRWAFHPSDSELAHDPSSPGFKSSSPGASTSAASTSAAGGSASSHSQATSSDGKGSIYAAIMAKRATIPPDALPAPAPPMLPAVSASSSRSINSFKVPELPSRFRTRAANESTVYAEDFRGNVVLELQRLLIEANKLTEESKKLKEAKGKEASPAGSWTEIEHPSASGDNSEEEFGDLLYDERAIEGQVTTDISDASVPRSVVPTNLTLLNADDLIPMSQESLAIALDCFLHNAERPAKLDVKGKGRALPWSNSSGPQADAPTFDLDPFSDAAAIDLDPFVFPHSPPTPHRPLPKTTTRLSSRRRQRPVRLEQDQSSPTAGLRPPGFSFSDNTPSCGQGESSRPKKIHRSFSSAPGGDGPALFSAGEGNGIARSPPDFQFTFTIPVNDPALRTQTPLISGAGTPALSLDSMHSPPNGSASLWLQRASGPASGPSRRPGLPPTTPNGGPVVDPLGTITGSQAGTPGLAIYRPPEELVTDGYFPQNGGPKDVRDQAAAVEAQGNGDAGNHLAEPADRQAANHDEAIMVDLDPFELGGVPDEDEDFGDDIQPEAQNEEIEPDEELDGIMEAIGMRGAVGNVFQNALLMSVLLDLILALGLFVPYTIGKTAALIALRPQQGVFLVKLPFRIVRVLTDPVVETAIVLVRLIGAPLFRTLGWTGASLLSESTMKGSSATSMGAKGVIFVQWARDSATQRVHSLAVQYLDGWRSSDAYNITARLARRYLENGEPEILARFRMGLLSTERLSLEGWRYYTERWSSHALGNGPRDRAFAVAVGYMVSSLLGAIYLALSSSAVGVPRRALRNTIRQQIIVVKVAIFIFIELVIFPLGCGTMIDYSTLPLFDSETLQARIAFLHHAPVTCIFIHWMVGTMFMYQFAVWLASIRSIIRRGGMWFIKDPGDPNFHPIRDMLDRPVLTQLRKLWMSAMMYFGVIAIGAGSVLFLVRRALATSTFPLLPLRWNMRDPLSVIPFDLLILSIVTPATIGKLRIRRAVLYSLSLWWPYMSRKLRLSSYMFGGRWADEEMFEIRGLRAQLMDWFNGQPRRFSKFRGSFRRAPAVDSVIFPPNTRGLVIVDEEGRPTSQQEVELAILQDEACRKAGTAPEDSFTLLYVPPFFRVRIYLFICSLWITAAAATLACFAIPVYLGRAAVHFSGRTPIHDGYTWTMGVYGLWALAVAWKECQRQSRKGMSTPQRMLRNGASRIFGVAYLIVTLGILIPTLLALVINFYLILPVRIDLGLSKPDIHMVDMWALGLMYMKIGDSMSRWHPPNQHARAFRQILATGFRQPNIVKATTEFIGPAIVGLVMMLIVPPSLILTFRPFIPLLRQSDSALVYGYPALFVISAAVACVDWLMRMLQSWVQRTRDAEFLLELRLTNLEKQEEKEKGEAKADLQQALPVA